MRSRRAAGAAVSLVATAVLAVAACEPAPENGSESSAPGQATAPRDSIALRRALDAQIGDLPGPIRYFAARADLDGDGQPEWIAHVVGPMVCGTGGCDTYVFAKRGGQLALVADIGVTRPPIGVAETSTNGWRDLVVHIAGGGGPTGDVLLHYDGNTYPGNPTAEPAEPLAEGTAVDVLIPEFEAFTDGKMLRQGE